MPKFVFLDVDGTLVDFNGEMSESTEHALKEAQRNGHKMILCTGRYYGQIYPWLLERVNFDGVVSSSGACIRYNGEVVFTRYYTTEQLKKLHSAYAEAEAGEYYQTDTGIITWNEESYERAKQVYRDMGMSEYIIDSVLPKPDFVDVFSVKNCEKSNFIGAKLKTDEMRALLGDEFNIDPISMGQGNDSSGEVNRADVNKGIAIHELISRVGGDMADTIAIGDSGNDFNMIKAARIGVAMGNATDKIKSVADMITDDVDKDGICKAFKRLELI